MKLIKDKLKAVREYRDQSDSEKALWIGHMVLLWGAAGYSIYHDIILGNWLIGLDAIIILSITTSIAALVYYKK